MQTNEEHQPSLLDRADAAVETAWGAISDLLAKLTYQELVELSDRQSDRMFSISNHFINEIFADEFGKRHQIIDPANYPVQEQPQS